MSHNGLNFSSNRTCNIPLERFYKLTMPTYFRKWINLTPKVCCIMFEGFEQNVGARAKTKKQEQCWDNPPKALDPFQIFMMNLAEIWILVIGLLLWYMYLGCLYSNGHECYIHKYTIISLMKWKTGCLICCKVMPLGLALIDLYFSKEKNILWL